MKFNNPIGRICEICGYRRGGGYDHRRCSRILQAVPRKKRQKARPKTNVRKLEQSLVYFLEDKGETPAYLETDVDYRAIERIKCGGLG